MQRNKRKGDGEMGREMRQSVTTNAQRRVIPRGGEGNNELCSAAPERQITVMTETCLVKIRLEWKGCQ